MVLASGGFDNAAPDAVSLSVSKKINSSYLFAHNVLALDKLVILRGFLLHESKLSITRDA